MCVWMERGDGERGRGGSVTDAPLHDLLIQYVDFGCAITWTSGADSMHEPGQRGIQDSLDPPSLYDDSRKEDREVRKGEREKERKDHD